MLYFATVFNGAQHPQAISLSAATPPGLSPTHAKRDASLSAASLLLSASRKVEKRTA